MDQTDLLVQEGVIVALGRGLSAPTGATVLELRGRSVVPGFIDAHVHVAAASTDLVKSATLPLTYVAATAFESLRAMVGRGFTTVRDNGGADHGIARAAAEGLAGPMPRVHFCGKALSQTGGHGDFRGHNEPTDSCSSIGLVCDGVDAVRQAIRRQLRDGASHVKLMLSGGVTSAHDRIDARQFSDDEVRAAVEEAENAGSYVTGHAYTPDAIIRAVGLGVRCIEHGNLLDDRAADAMAMAEAFLVPTLVTYSALAKDVRESNAPPFVAAKLQQVIDAGLIAVQRAQKAGVRIAFGTDLLGSRQGMQLEEFAIRRDVQSNADVLRSATTIGAALLQQESTIGTLGVGARADLIVTEIDPLVDPLETVTEGDSLVVVGGRAVSMNPKHQ